MKQFAMRPNIDVKRIQQEVVMGDVTKNSIREIWQGEKFNLVRKWHLEAGRNNIEICRGCNHWDREFKEIETGGNLWTM